MMKCISFAEIMKSVILRHCKKCKTLDKVPDTEFRIRCEKCNYKFLFKCKLCTVSYYCLKVTRQHVLKFHKQVFLKNNNSPPQLISYVGTINSQSEREVNNQIKLNLNLKKNSKKSFTSSVINHERDFFCKFCDFKIKSKHSLKEHLIKDHKDRFKIEELEGIIDDTVTFQPPLIGMINKFPELPHAEFVVLQEPLIFSSLIILFNQACYFLVHHN